MRNAKAQVPEYKILTAGRLMDQLKAAKGILPFEKPTFFLVETLPNPRFSVAMAYPDFGEIYLQESAYDLCVREFGADSLRALSVILSHELVHFLRKHGVVNHFAWQFDKKFTQDSAVVEVLDAALPEGDPDRSGFLSRVESLLSGYESRKKEAEADLDGGFLSYLAGFPIGDIGPTLMDKVYGFYGIDSILPTYPSLAERRTIAVRTAEKLQVLEYWYESANLFLTMGLTDLALSQYLRLVGEFPGREMYNNMGVICMLAADKLFKGTDRPGFILPLSLDIHSRLERGTRGDDDAAERKMKRDSILRIAIDFLSRASQLDGEYSLATLNLGCAEWMLAWSNQADRPMWSEYLAKALGHAYAAERQANASGDWSGRDHTVVSANILKAMAVYREKDSVQTVQILEALQGFHPDDQRIAANLQVAKKIANSGPKTSGTCRNGPVSFSPAYLGDPSIHTIKDYFNTVLPNSTTIDLEPGERPNEMSSLQFAYKIQPGDIRVYSQTWTDWSDHVGQVAVMWGPGNFDETSACDLELSGMEAEELDMHFGKAERIIPVPGGELRYYFRGQTVINGDNFKPIGTDTYGIIVRMEDGKGVAQWGLTLTYDPKEDTAH